MERQGRRDTKPEMQLRRALWRRGLRYRVDRAPLKGMRRRADIIFGPAKVVVYVDGCFWHSCPEHATIPKSNRQWWIDKLQTNVRRDRDTDRQLEDAGWHVVHVWEHEDMEEAAERIASVVAENRHRSEVSPQVLGRAVVASREMEAPGILVESLRTRAITDKYGNDWQYHSRSDRHSKVVCWGVALDMIATSALLRRHVAAGKVVLGVNHTMRDFSTGRKKDLDLVFARPAGTVSSETSLSDLAGRYGVDLNPRQRSLLADLPEWPIAPVGAVLVALEAKATMTAHIRALPRLYDELNSSHVCVHGASRQALAIGLVIINASPSFASSDMNKGHVSTGLVFTEEPQPKSVKRTLEKVAEIPRRSNVRETGFDGIGVIVIRGRNDGTPFELVSDAPAPQAGESFHYDGMIARMANEYDTSFAEI